jgi:ATP-binding cassette, subfamily F, member 3
MCKLCTILTAAACTASASCHAQQPTSCARGVGIGKSTLLGLISGALEATSGHITRNSSVRMATFSQHHMDGLELHLSPLQYFARVFVNEKEDKLRSHLSNFGISGDLALQAMYTLSGGQKSRVAFAKVRAAPGHALTA